MFEQEADERTKQYVGEHIEKYNCENTHLETDNYNVGLETGYEAGFQDGAEFGYNKAKEWHYPSKGELPEEVKLVLLKVPGCYMLGWYRDKTWFFDGNYFDGYENEIKCNVLAWQYIEPPKEVNNEAGTR